MIMLVSGSAIGTTAIADSGTVTDLVPVGVADQCEPLGSDEERLQQISAKMKEEDVTLAANKVPVVAKVFNKACVSSNSFNDTASVTGGKESLSVFRNFGFESNCAF